MDQAAKSSRPSKARAPRPKRRWPAEVLSDDEVRALMGACGRYAPTGLRHRALIALLYRSGLRISEALSLYPKDITTTAVYLDHLAPAALLAAIRRRTWTEA